MRLHSISANANSPEDKWTPSSSNASDIEVALGGLCGGTSYGANSAAVSLAEYGVQTRKKHFAGTAVRWESGALCADYGRRARAKPVPRGHCESPASGRLTSTLFVERAYDIYVPSARSLQFPRWRRNAVSESGGSYKGACHLRMRTAAATAAQETDIKYPRRFSIAYRLHVRASLSLLSLERSKKNISRLGEPTADFCFAFQPVFCGRGREKRERENDRCKICE